MFLELKYCKHQNAVKNLNKARNQVFATYNYYKNKGIIKNKDSTAKQNEVVTIVTSYYTTH